MNKAKKMLLAGFLACMVLGTGSAMMACGGGDTSSSGETSTPDPWALEDVSVTYTVDKDGVEWATYSAKANVGEAYEKTVKTGRTVEAILDVRLGDAEVYGGQVIYMVGINEVADPEIQVQFSDGSTGWVTVTEEMISWGEYDLTKPGMYTVEVYCGAYAEATITVVDYSKLDTPMQTYFQNNGPTYLWTKAEVEGKTMYMPGMEWMYYAMAGEEISVPVKASEVAMVGTFTEDGMYDFIATNENGTEGYFSAYVCEDLADVEMADGSEWINQTSWDSIYIVKNGKLDVSNFYITKNTADYIAARAIPVTEAMVTLDTSAAGMQTATISYKVEDTELASTTVDVYVYDDTKVEHDVEINLMNYDVVESGIPVMAISDEITTTYLNGETELGVEEEYAAVLITEDMLKNAPDFTTPGVKVITVTYNGKDYKTAVELKGEATTNVKSMAIYSRMMGEISSLTLDKGADIAYAAKSTFVGQQAQVEYYKEVIGSQGYVTITKDMLDWSKVDTSKAGEYVLYINYKGYAKEIAVTVNEEIGDAELVYALQGDQMAPVQAYGDMLYMANLYDNGLAEVYFSHPMMGGAPKVMVYTLNTEKTVVEFAENGKKTVIASVTMGEELEGVVYGNVDTYAFSAADEETAKTYIYTAAAPYGGTYEAELKVYANGYAVSYPVEFVENVQFVVVNVEGDFVTFADGTMLFINGTELVEIEKDYNY